MYIAYPWQRFRYDDVYTTNHTKALYSCDTRTIRQPDPIYDIAVSGYYEYTLCTPAALSQHFHGVLVLSMALCSRLTSGRVCYRNGSLCCLSMHLLYEVITYQVPYEMMPGSSYSYDTRSSAARLYTDTDGCKRRTEEAKCP